MHKITRDFFERVGGAWKQRALIRGRGAGPGSKFGSVVAVSGSLGLIGAPRDDGGYGTAVAVMLGRGAPLAQGAPTKGF